MSIQGDKAQLGKSRPLFELRPYPINLSDFHHLKQYAFDSSAIPCQISIAGYQPTTIAQNALFIWNIYLATEAEDYRRIFLTKARWLVENESRIGNDIGGWPISLTHLDSHIKGLSLSSLMQGIGISVLVRAYQLTREEVFIKVAYRAVHTFERDILDGGVCAPISNEEFFYEEVAVYPAAHIFFGFIFGLFGLYDYFDLTGDIHIEKLINCSHVTMHKILNEFDIGFWTCIDLLHRRLATKPQLILQVKLLETLARYTKCAQCSTVALKWNSYHFQWRTNIRYQIINTYRKCSRPLFYKMQSRVFPKSHTSSLHVCIAISAFPVVGGVLTILEKIAEVTMDVWQIEYFTQSIGSNTEKYVIHRFGMRMASPWHFPFVWLYVFTGFYKLISLMHQQPNYNVILPQDAIFTGAFVALASKITGTRVVCFDHGELNLLIKRNNHINRVERLQDIENRKLHWFVRLVARQLLMLYWPSRYLMARVASHFIDHYLIPGVPGDGLDELCKRLRVNSRRITRFANMINLDRHIIPDNVSRISIREKYGIAADAVVIAIICRLAPEKGLEIALEAISQALITLATDLQSRIRVIIAGDGRLRKQIEDDICSRGFKEICLLWGEASSEEVIMILGMSDIFLYTSRRGAGFPLAILEAMASRCAVIASNEPLANEFMLAECRGIIVPVGDAVKTGKALVSLLNDSDLRLHMGNLARDYIALHHSPAMFKRTLMRATYWSGLEELFDAGEKFLSG